MAGLEPASSRRQRTLPTVSLSTHLPLQVLRASKEGILTVIEVFIHDPLYKWALTTTAAARRQHDAPGGDDDDDGSGVAAPGAADIGGVTLANADAERTLLRVKQKLEGVEAGVCACARGGVERGEVLAGMPALGSPHVRFAPLPQARARRAAWRGRCSSCCRTRRTPTSCAACTWGGSRGCEAEEDRPPE